MALQKAVTTPQGFSATSAFLRAVTGWGSVFAIPEVEGHFANLYDCECPESLVSYQVPEPATPYNVRW